MISSLGFIPNSQNVRRLSKFTADPEIKQKLSYLQIPLVEDGLEQSCSTEEEIKDSDQVLFCTSNDEITSLAFYGYDRDEMFYHHDIFVFSTIIDSCYLGSNLVALATFEADIFVYDAFTNFPVLPQKLLSGHKEAVTGIKNKEDKIRSCSEDKSIVEWDLNRYTVKEQHYYDVSIEKFDYEGDVCAFGNKNYLCINNENIQMEGEIGQIRVRDGVVYVGDSGGVFSKYDVRNLSRPLAQSKLHDDSILDICFVGNLIATTSFDNTVKVWKDEGELVELMSARQESTVYCMGCNEGYTERREIFCGNGSDVVFPIEIVQKDN